MNRRETIQHFKNAMMKGQYTCMLQSNILAEIPTEELLNELSDIPMFCKINEMLTPHFRNMYFKNKYYQLSKQALELYNFENSMKSFLESNYTIDEYKPTLLDNVKKGDFEAVLKNLEEGESPSSIYFNREIIWYAIYNNHFDIVKLLIEKGARFESLFTDLKPYDISKLSSNRILDVAEYMFFKKRKDIAGLILEKYSKTHDIFKEMKEIYSDEFLIFCLDYCKDLSTISYDPIASENVLIEIVKRIPQDKDLTNVARFAISNGHLNAVRLILKKFPFNKRIANAFVYNFFDIYIEFFDQVIVYPEFSSSKKRSANETLSYDSKYLEGDSFDNLKQIKNEVHLTLFQYFFNNDTSSIRLKKKKTKDIKEIFNYAIKGDLDSLKKKFDENKNNAKVAIPGTNASLMDVAYITRNKELRDLLEEYGFDYPAIYGSVLLPCFRIVFGMSPKSLSCRREILHNLTTYESLLTEKYEKAEYLESLIKIAIWTNHYDKAEDLIEKYIKVNASKNIIYTILDTKGINSKVLDICNKFVPAKESEYLRSKNINNDLIMKHFWPNKYYREIFCFKKSKQLPEDVKDLQQALLAKDYDRVEELIEPNMTNSAIFYTMFSDIKFISILQKHGFFQMEILKKYTLEIIKKCTKYGNAPFFYTMCKYGLMSNNIDLYKEPFLSTNINIFKLATIFFPPTESKTDFFTIHLTNASYNGSLAVTKYILEECNFLPDESSVEQSLYNAIHYNHFGIFDYIIHKFIIPQSIISDLLENAFKKYQIPFINLLFKDFNCPEIKYDILLNTAARWDSMELARIVEKYMTQKEGLDLSSPLKFAAYYNNIEMVKMLIRNGAKANKKSYGYAMENKSMECIQLLISTGKTKPGLYEATKNYKEYAKLMIEAHGNINEVLNKNGDTALHLLASNNAVDIIEYALTFNPEEKSDNDGFTPLHNAVSKSYKAMKLFVEYGFNVNAESFDQKFTPLSFTDSRYSRAKYLLKHGANPNAPGVDFSAIAHACANNHIKTFKLLKSAGAIPKVDDVKVLTSGFKNYESLYWITDKIIEQCQKSDFTDEFKDYLFENIIFTPVIEFTIRLIREKGLRFDGYFMEELLVDIDTAILFHEAGCLINPENSGSLRRYLEFVGYTVFENYNNTAVYIHDLTFYF